MPFFTLFTIIALLSTTGWAGYVLEDDYFANGFFDQFSFWNSADPTNGFVEYKNYDDALNAKLISNTSSNIYMGVDSANVCPTGRPSVRITSNKSYNLGLVVVDIEHMPGGVCGTWPAFWTVGPDWPNGGEIDILEGVHDQVANQMTLHTGPGCSISNTGTFTGVLATETCASSGTDNTGCAIGAANSSTNTYGSGFNANKGGTYATEWTADFINIWFFPRGACPDDVLGESPDPSGWGEPLATFSGDCNFGTAFKDQQIVFDTTFCGDWAGKTWSSSTCASKADTCDAYVQNNPEAFKDTYWSVNALKVYQANDNSAPAQSTVVATSTSVAYVTQPESSYIAQSTIPAVYPTTLTVSTQSAPVPPTYPSSSASENSPPEAASGYALTVAGDGTIGEGTAPTASSVASAAAAAAPSNTGGGEGGGGGWGWSDSNGEAGYGWHDRGRRDAESERGDGHARHLRKHKRHGRGRI